MVGLLMAECAVVLLLCLPLRCVHTVARACASALAARSTIRILIWVLCTLVLLMALDSFQGSMPRDLASADGAKYQQATTRLARGSQSLRFRNQRNLYICAFVLFNVLIIYRLIRLLSKNDDLRRECAELRAAPRAQPGCDRCQPYVSKSVRLAPEDDTHAKDD